MFDSNFNWIFPQSSNQDCFRIDMWNSQNYTYYTPQGFLVQTLTSNFLHDASWTTFFFEGETSDKIETIQRRLTWTMLSVKYLESISFA
uniref:Uncharacterized protein n=1 Tax=Arundo donax TaxID=35708 RepID=A0A0A9GSQ7_ARUDO